ncbi:MAG: cellulose synthase, partial [Bacteroidetes bacterium]|nr:cellulose synthase [Bacteroidota bacterium]
MRKSYSSEKIIKVEPPRKSEVYTIRFLIMCGIVMMITFVIWFINPDHIGYSPIFWLLTFALLFKLVKMIHEWYHYWSVSIPVRPESKKEYTVDILTTACPGEPRDMIIRTLQAMVNITYPHTNYLCDEGDDPVLKKVCQELGVVHVTRVEKINAKAGNINNALKQATGEICVVLDPDHVPIPEFLDRTLPYFEDETIGFVQSVQAYGNQSESIIARGAAEQTYHFYGPMMMCMNSYGTVQAIGANCVFRRKALDSIGGHAAGLSEDMHTAMQLHAKGWRSIYVPEILTRGLVPATLSSYYKQQLKWSRGTFELLFRTYPELYKNFTWRQKIHYFTIPLYFLFGLVNLIDIIVPAVALGFAQVPWEVDLSHFALFFVPLCGLSMLIRLYAQRWLLEKHERGFHLAGGILRTATWWIFLIGFIYTIFKIKVPYIPTPKEDEHQNYWKLSIPNLIVSVFCGLVILYGLSLDWSPYSFAMAFYALINVVMLGFIVMMSQQKLLNTVKEKIRTVPSVNYVVLSAENLLVKSEELIYRMFRIGPVAL